MDIEKPAAVPQAAAREDGGSPSMAAPAGAALVRVFRYWELVPLLGLALVLALTYLLSAPAFGLPFDDSYISLQFARNLADHGYLTFDGEEASAGATSVLHVALLALPIRLGAPPEEASVALGVICQLALVVAVYWLARTVFHDRLAAAFAGFSATVIGYLAFDALNGMETTLFMVTTTAAAAAFLGARNEGGLAAAGVLAALAVLTRPEAVLLLAAMALYYAVDPARQEPLLSSAAARRLALLTAPAAITLGALAIFHGVTTGSVTPGTATAKLLFFREFENDTMWRFDAVRSGLGNFIAPVLPWVALAALGARKREALLFAFLWSFFIILYFFAFPGGLTHYWYRYQHVFLPAIAVFAGGGFAWLVRGRAFRPVDLAAFALIGGVLLAGMALQVEAFRGHYTNDVRISETRGLAVAEYLRVETPPGSNVATHDIGHIGYFSDREVIDLVGLINPDVVEYHDGRRLREYIDSVQPDYIVVFQSWEDLFLHLGLNDDPQLFEKIAEFPGGPEPFLVYETHYEEATGAR
jgi:hypothetical protein